MMVMMLIMMLLLLVMMTVMMIMMMTAVPSCLDCITKRLWATKLTLLQPPTRSCPLHSELPSSLGAALGAGG